MKRYDMEICEEYNHDMVEVEDGDYVLYSDIKDQADKIQGLVGLLEVANCPNCGGVGYTVVEGIGCEAGCCGNFNRDGSCCGNAIPVPVQIQEQEQCQWCYEKDQALTVYKEGK